MVTCSSRYVKITETSCHLVKRNLKYSSRCHFVVCSADNFGKYTDFQKKRYIFPDFMHL